MFLKCEKGKKMNQTERDAIEYINRHASELHKLSIADIAAGANVSTSTVSRAIRKCGMDSMASIRYRMGKDVDVENVRLRSDILENIRLECMYTIENIEEEAILQLVKQIKRAKKIYIIASGLNYGLVREFVLQLQCQRYDVCVLEDLLWDSIKGIVKPGDLVILFTCQGGRARLINIARNAKRAGGTLAYIGLLDNQEIEKLCDVSIRGYSRIVTMNEKFRVTSRVGFSIITRAIVEYMAFGNVDCDEDTEQLEDNTKNKNNKREEC